MLNICPHEKLYFLLRNSCRTDLKWKLDISQKYYFFAYSAYNCNCSQQKEIAFSSKIILYLGLFSLYLIFWIVCFYFLGKLAQLRQVMIILDIAYFEYFWWFLQSNWFTNRVYRHEHTTPGFQRARFVQRYTKGFTKGGILFNFQFNPGQ